MLHHKTLGVYSNSFDTRGVLRPLGAIIERILDGKRELDEKTKMCNTLASTDPKAYKRYKESRLPAVTFSGTFPKGKRKAQHLIQHSGHVVLDIDGLLPSQIPDLLAELAQDPRVLLAFISPSGTGIKVIVRVDPIPQNDLEHKGAYQACLETFADLAEEYGFEIDTSGKDCSRLCYLAYDPLAIFNANATAIKWDKEAWLKAEKEKQERFEEAAKIPFTGEADTKALEYIDPNDLDYNQWLSVITACKVAGLSWQQADAWSRRGGVRYVEGEVEQRWDSLNLNVSWGAVVNLAKLNGYTPPRRPRAKLQRSHNVETNNNYGSLNANRASCAAGIEASFVSAENAAPDALHIHLVQDSTGGGKTYTTLAKAQQYGKRTLAQLPHSDLATQAVKIAAEHGFKNPFHLVGREHNWEASGIEQIPPEARTKDLFARNNCLMVDVLKEYTNKRLAPRTYCELKCPFRDGCPHLAQYEGLAARDFVASCSPNLLFDINMRGYLKTLVTATEEPSAEDLAIDAMMGTATETLGVFDFAILDDYSISGLYTDVAFTASEFKALKKVWKGTPTGEFAKKMLKAFKKKRPHAIVKALRHAFQSTKEHHTEIATHLTQHARNGVVEWAERPKGSKETERLLAEKQVRYDDDGAQFIPVDFAAYQELTDKGVPTIHPQHLHTETVGDPVRVAHTPTHALIAGVPIEALTPIWQSGATPIELLDIFLNSIGNDKNAPIHRSFLAGVPPEPVLTFSIPPRAPVGILPHIALLSATTDIEDTKRAFDGQPVTFSEHIGGQLALADGVAVYQFTDARLTSASVFDYKKDTDGKRKLQETPIGLTPTAENRLAKLNDWAKATEGLTAFISYKEFTESPFSEVVNGFDIVSHFDKVTGLNFDGLKFLVVFGYPKVKHEVVMGQGRKQYASDSNPLPKGSYEELTETAEYQENGITITESRYLDPRLEKVRHQLSTEKLEQAIGRARLVTWTDTKTLIITNAPVKGITERATLFSDEAFNLAEAPSELPQAMQRIQNAIETGDVQAVMETTGVSKRTAERRTKPARALLKVERDAQIIALHDQGLSQQEIENEMKASGNKVSNGTIRNVFKARKKRQDQLGILIGDDVFCAPSENVPSEHVEDNTQEERSRPAWHDDPYYSEKAIRERMRESRQELIPPGDLPNEARKSEMKQKSVDEKTCSVSQITDQCGSEPMTAERTAELLLAGINPDGTPIIEREPQTTVDTSELTPELQALCTTIVLPESLQKYLVKQPPPSEVLESAEAYLEYRKQQHDEEIDAYKTETLRQYATGVDMNTIAKSLHINIFAVKQWVQETPL